MRDAGVVESGGCDWSDCRAIGVPGTWLETTVGALLAYTVKSMVCCQMYLRAVTYKIKPAGECRSMQVLICIQRRTKATYPTQTSTEVSPAMPNSLVFFDSLLTWRNTQVSSTRSRSTHRLLTSLIRLLSCAYSCFHSSCKPSSSRV
jgi:hypothetical protein